MIELHPENAGSPIIGDWKGASALYLVGGSDGFRFRSRIQPGDMPVAVACCEEHGVLIAPVHPMCHVSAEGQSVTPVAQGEWIQLGPDKFRLSVQRPSNFTKLNKRRLLIAVLVASALAGGWLLHDLFSVSSNTVAVTDAYIF